MLPICPVRSVTYVLDRSYKTRDQARASLFDYMEVFCNRQQHHSTLNYEAPLAFEAMQVGLLPVQ